MDLSCCYCGKEHRGIECPLLVDVKKKYGIDRMTSNQRKDMSDRILQRLIDGLYHKDLKNP